MTYAVKTKVSVEQTRTEIERTLTKYGAKSFAYFTEAGRAVVMFEASDRRIRFDLAVPQGNTDRDAQLKRSRWRALLLCIKAKLESVESKIESFEEAFLAHVVMPNGQTVGDNLKPQLALAYETNSMVPLLPAPPK